MRKIAMLIPLVLGACDAPAREDQPTLPPEPPASAPAKPVADGVVPLDFQGRWGLVPADCEAGRADAKGLMIVEAARLRFYESRAKVQKWTGTGPLSAQVSLAFSGEGQEWTEETPMTLSADRSTLTRESQGKTLTYTKCPA